ncbi:MAG: GFA family protein [Myxococcales bacterium]|nr:GFA family protein [Myxococcales bacterium]
MTERGFCKHCGSNLYYRLKEADKDMMMVGAIDEREKFSLVGEIFVDHQPKGFAGELERLSEAETVARFTSQ